MVVNAAFLEVLRRGSNLSQSGASVCAEQQCRLGGVLLVSARVHLHTLLL